MLERLGRYEILERIASGGQGTVYRAHDPELDRTVAIKVMNQQFIDGAYLTAFQREARLAAGLDHPNITTIYDLQVEDDTAFIVMEFVPDGLDRHIAQGRRLPWRRAVEIAAQVARALQHAHEKGVVHRDIKPSNVLLRADGAAAVSDFGIARAFAASTRSRTASVTGTPPYMAPEQWSGAPVDGRLDQYALGIVLYEMISGRLPFQGDSMEAFYVQHRETPMPPLPANLGVPQTVGYLIDQAAAKNPNSRFRDAGVMAIALESALSNYPLGEPPEARLPRQLRSPFDDRNFPPVPPSEDLMRGIGPGRGQPRKGIPRWALFAGILGLVAVSVLGIAIAENSGQPSEDSPLIIDLDPTTTLLTSTAPPTMESVPAATPAPGNSPQPTESLSVVTPLPTNTIAPTYTPLPTYTLAPTYTPLPTSTPRPTPTPRVIVVTATPPPTSECMQVSESNAVTSVGITPPSYSISFRVTNNCGKSAYAEPTIILFDDGNRILTSRTFTGAWIDQGSSQVLTKQISANRGTSVNTFQIEID